MELHITPEHEKTILTLAAKIKGSYGGRMKAANKRAKNTRASKRNGRVVKRAA